MTDTFHIGEAICPLCREPVKMEHHDNLGDGESMVCSKAGQMPSSAAWSEADERELVSGMIEERTSSASAWPGLVDDIIAYADGARRQAVEEVARAVDGDAPGDYQRRTIAKEIRAMAAPFTSHAPEKKT